MRIAWIGPAPGNQGGVAYMGTQLLEAVTSLGVEVECFVAAAERSLPESLTAKPGLRFLCYPPRWTWGRWYSRTPLSAFLTGQSARAIAQGYLAKEIADRHARFPYDVVYQFSQIELFALRRFRDRLPPIVLHPEVHAAGELRWHRLERALALRGESQARYWAVRSILATRAAIQTRDIRLAGMVIAPSARFAHHLEQDYGLPPERLRIVPNPVDLNRFHLPLVRKQSRPLSMLFVSRIAVRKGVDMIVALSNRLSDLKGRVRIHVIGDMSLWSDYRPLLTGLHPDVAAYDGPAEPARMASLFRSADLVLQPSQYEPFALTVAEALASGVPVVASDEVGAVEGVDGRCCAVFPAGDLDAFEAEVRRFVDRLEKGEGRSVACLARAEAERLFTPRVVASTLVSRLEELSEAEVAGRS